MLSKHAVTAIRSEALWFGSDQPTTVSAHIRQTLAGMLFVASAKFVVESRSAVYVATAVLANTRTLNTHTLLRACTHGQANTHLVPNVDVGNSTLAISTHVLRESAAATGFPLFSFVYDLSALPIFSLNKPTLPL